MFKKIIISISLALFLNTKTFNSDSLHENTSNQSVVDTAMHNFFDIIFFCVGAVDYDKEMKDDYTHGVAKFFMPQKPIPQEMNKTSKFSVAQDKKNN